MGHPAVEMTVWGGFGADRHFFVCMERNFLRGWWGEDAGGADFDCKWVLLN